MNVLNATVYLKFVKMLIFILCIFIYIIYIFSKKGVSLLNHLLEPPYTDVPCLTSDLLKSGSKSDI